MYFWWTAYKLCDLSICRRDLCIDYATDAWFCSHFSETRSVIYRTNSSCLSTVCKARCFDLFIVRRRFAVSRYHNHSYLIFPFADKHRLCSWNGALATSVISECRAVLVGESGRLDQFTKTADPLITSPDHLGIDLARQIHKFNLRHISLYNICRGLTLLVGRQEGHHTCKTRCFSNS